MTNFIDNYVVVYTNQYKIKHSCILFVDKDLIKIHKTASVVLRHLLQTVQVQRYSTQNKNNTQLHVLLLLPLLLDQQCLEEETQQNAEETYYCFSTAFWTIQQQNQIQHLVQ